MIIFKKSTLLSVAYSAIIFIGYPIIIDSSWIFSSLLLIYIFFVLSINYKKVKSPFFFRRIVLIQIIILVYMYLTSGNISNNHFSNIEGYSLFSEHNIFLNSVVMFVIFSLGMLYGYNIKDPLFVLSKTITFFALLFIFYISVVYFYIADNLLFGLMMSILLPYIFLNFSKNGGDGLNKYSYSVSVLIILFLLMIGNRASTVAMLIFYISYYFYPYTSKSALRSNLSLLFYLVILGFSVVAYGMGGLMFLDDFSFSISGKTMHTGRAEIWSELFLLIENSLIFGYGVNQSSTFIYSSSLGRNLSSHNTFIELLLRGGIVLILLIFYYIYIIYSRLRLNTISVYGRISQSMIYVFIWQSCWDEVGFSLNPVINSTFWIFIGVSLGRVIKEKNRD